MRHKRTNVAVSASHPVLQVHADDPWSVSVAAFLREEDVKGRSRRTLALHRESFGSARRHLDATGAPQGPVALRRDHLTAMVLHMREAGLEPRTINLRLQSLRQLLEFLRLQGQVTDNAASTVPRQRELRRPPRALSDEEAVRFLSQPDRSTFVGLRDSAILMLLLDTGMRLFEVVALEHTDIDLRQRAIQLRAEVTKTREGRIVFFSRETGQEIERYLRERGQVSTERVFVGWDERPLASATLQERIQKYAAAARVRCSPHTLRHTFARMYLMSGGDAFSLQQLLGHRDAASTAIYARLWSRDLKQLHERHAPITRLRRK